jgi:hypothetical protein
MFCASEFLCGYLASSPLAQICARLSITRLHRPPLILLSVSDCPDSKARVLGHGIVANQPVPPGEIGTDIRLKTSPRRLDDSFILWLLSAVFFGAISPAGAALFE